MTKEKILHIIGGGEFGGAERHVLSLMQNTDQDRFSPMLACLCPGPFAQMAADEGFTAVTWPMSHKLDLRPRRQLRQFLKDEGISLVHTHGVRANFLARPLARKLALPVVTTFHSELSFDYRRRAEYWFAALLTRLGNSCTDVYIAVSSAIAHGMPALGIPPEKIFVIHNGIDPRRFLTRWSRLQFRQYFSLPADALVVGTVARLHPVKGHPYLLKAAPSLVKEFPQLYFVLIGDGSDKTQLQALAKELGIQHRIIFAGFMPDVEQLYPAMDIFCLPSLMEGMGISLVESMYCGTPVVATQVGGIPELVTGEVDGLLVPPGDAASLGAAIRRLLVDGALAKGLAAAGQQKAQKFTVQAMTRQVENVYDGLLIKKD